LNPVEAKEKLEEIKKSRLMLNKWDTKFLISIEERIKKWPVPI